MGYFNETTATVIVHFPGGRKEVFEPVVDVNFEVRAEPLELGRTAAMTGVGPSLPYTEYLTLRGRMPQPSSIVSKVPDGVAQAALVARLGVLREVFEWVSAVVTPKHPDVPGNWLLDKIEARMKRAEELEG